MHDMREPDMTYTFEHSDADGDHVDRFEDLRSAMKAARTEWTLTLEADRRYAVDSSQGHSFRVVDGNGNTVHDWASHLIAGPDRYVLPDGYGEYLDGFFSDAVPSDLVSEAYGDPERAADRWIRDTFVRGSHAESNTARLRETLDIGPDELRDAVAQWLAQEYDDYTIANAVDDIKAEMTGLIMDHGLSVGEAQAYIIRKTGHPTAETAAIMSRITGKRVPPQRVTNAMRAAKVKMALDDAEE